MMFWMGILIAAISAYLAVKRGFYETWIILFDIVISIYLAISLNPIIVSIPALGNSSFTNTLAITAVAVASFVILYAIAYICFMGQFNVALPKLLDILGAGFLGFFSGLLLWFFFSFIICITPVARNSFIKYIGFNQQSIQAGVSYICFWTDFVESMVSSDNSSSTTKQTLNDLLKTAEKYAELKTAEPNEPNLADPAIIKDSNLTSPIDANSEEPKE